MRMAVAFSKINPFNPTQDEWPLMSNHRDICLTQKNTDAAKKRAILLSVIGDGKLSEHFTPAPSEIVQCLKFHTRFRKTGESVTAFVSELRSIAKCGDTLKTMLRDCIVCGINDAVI